MSMIFDGHLDLALNALQFKRDFTLSLDALRDRHTPEAIGKVGTAGITFEELSRGNVRIVVSTLLARAKPWTMASPIPNGLTGDWPTQAMAYGVAQGQLAWYRLMEQQGYLHIITNKKQLQEATQQRELPGFGVILTLEGADPVVEPEQLHTWHAQGLRTLMLAHFGQSFYAAGTPTEKKKATRDIDGPLTAMGVRLLGEISKLGMPLDLTHLSDLSFAQAVEKFSGPIYSSHTACRALVPNERNHRDEQLKIIIERGGVIGLPMFNRFLDPAYPSKPKRHMVRSSLGCFANHVEHICNLAGSADHVAIGSDIDGGFGIEHTPVGIDSIADLVKIRGELASRGFSADDIEKVVSGNWMRFYREHLPEA